MFRTLRTICVLGFLVVLLWGAFKVKLGKKTFAEHMDTIGKTKAARELVQGTRATIHPIIDEIKRRMVGEYIEAPASLSSWEDTEAAVDENTM